MSIILELDLTDYEYKRLYSQAGIRGHESIEDYVLELIEGNSEKLYNFSRLDVKPSLITYLCEKNLESSVNIMEDFKKLLKELSGIRYDIGLTYEGLLNADSENEKEDIYSTLEVQSQELKDIIETLELTKENFESYMNGIEYDWEEQVFMFIEWYSLNVHEQ